MSVLRFLHRKPRPITSSHRFIHGKAFGQKLIGAGIVPPNTRRVIIDISVNDVVKLYVELIGDERMYSINVERMLRQAAMMPNETSRFGSSAKTYQAS